MKRKMTGIVIIGFLLIATFYLMAHINRAKDTIHYTALGDSIAAGVGASENHGYTDLLNQHFRGIYKTVDYANVAQSGDTSGDLLKKLEESDTVRKAVKKADVITICIGGNDLLSGAGQLLDGDFSSLSDQISGFQKNWGTILAAIREINPLAEIYAMDLYNPISVGDVYGGVRCDRELWEVIDGNIRKLNNVITSRDNQNKYKYRTAEVYAAFQQYEKQGQRLTGFAKDSDPHPTDEGHRMIFNQYRELEG